MGPVENSPASEGSKQHTNAPWQAAGHLGQVPNQRFVSGLAAVSPWDRWDYPGPPPLLSALLSGAQCKQRGDRQLWRGKEGRVMWWAAIVWVGFLQGGSSLDQGKSTYECEIWGSPSEEEWGWSEVEEGTRQGGGLRSRSEPASLPYHVLFFCMWTSDNSSTP